ncbi:MAG: hypothetical protein ACFFAE_10025 [Candidatus Hodarchaeota archaeon]
MSDDFSSSISLLADLELKECSKCKKPTETTKLIEGLCPVCKKKIKRRSTLIISDRKKTQPKTRKPKSSKTLEILEARISEQQTLIDSLKSKNNELKSQTFQLKDRIQILENRFEENTIKHTGKRPVKTYQVPQGKIVSGEVTYQKEEQEKIIIAFYSYEKKIHEFFTVDQVTDQIILKMILLIEASLNSAEQIHALEIIGNNFLQNGKSTPKSDVREYIRASAVSFNKTFLPLSNERMKNLGARSFHCEILEETYTDDLIPVYNPSNLGERFFTIRSVYFDETQVIKRIKTSFGRKLIARKGEKLYKVIFDHYTKQNRPVTRQELFNSYNLGKYEIDTFKHNLIEVGLIKKVPLPLSKRYNQNQRIPRSEIPLQPRHLAVGPNDLKRILWGIKSQRR